MSLFDITIKVEYEIDPDKWDDFIKHAEGGSFFSFSEYYKMQMAEIFYITAYDKDLNIVGGIIGRIRGSLFPISIFSKSLWVESGILTKMSDPDKKKELKLKLVSRLELEGRKQKCVIIRFNHWCRELKSDVFFNNGFDAIPNSTFICDLKKSEEDLFSRLAKGNKSTIKKARKSNIQIVFLDFVSQNIIDDFYNLYKITQQRAINSSTKVSMTLRSKDFLIKILQDTELPCYLVCAYIENKLAAAAILLENIDTTIYFIGASDIELNRKYGASNLIIWESMLRSKKKGVNYFDFGGVPTEPSPDNPAFGVL